MAPGAVWSRQPSRGGKGSGKFDVQNTFGGGLPTSHEETIGHALGWNTACQYHVSEVLWPELEVNSTFWKDGEDNGLRQTFRGADRAFPVLMMKKSLAAASLALLCLGIQAAEPGRLAVTGAVERPLNIQISDLEKMPHVRVDVKDHDGNVITYEGVPVAELLKAAGAPIGEKLRGPNMAAYILAEAKDGYRVVFALPELDPAFTDSQVLVAYAANGKPLPDGQGPFRIVAPQEKRPARWIRMLQQIQVVKIQE